MIASIIELVIRFRWLVGCVVTMLVGERTLRTVALDAIPDISDPQIIVYAKWPRSPLLIETEVTEPVIRLPPGSPDVQSIRGYRTWGTRSSTSSCRIRPDARPSASSFRSVSTQSAASCLPDANVTVGPNASSMGWIFQVRARRSREDPRPARAASAERESDQARAPVGAGRRRSRLRWRPREAVS